MSGEPTRILVIDDEESICFAFQRYFEQRGCKADVAATGRQGVVLFRERRPDVVFLDVRLPDGSGLDVLEQLREVDRDACVIVITAYSGLETVARAFRNRAFDYLVKPLDLDRAAELVAQAMASKAVMSAAEAAPPSDALSGAEATLVGSSPPMQEVYKLIGKAAQAEATVLIRGDTGTGKELVARAIHEHSRRRSGPFVPVNCGALPESLVESELFGYAKGAFTGATTEKPGRFESADGGTLFLDEVGDLPLAAQVKLLRFLDSQTIEHLGSVHPIHLDVRILAATHRDLPRAIDAGQFRADLFYRLAVIRIELPPLVDRIDDVIPLAAHFLANWAGPDRPAPPVSNEAAEVLKRHTWPGNVRELRNAVEHAAIVSSGGPILPSHLPEAVRTGSAGGASSAGAPLDTLIRQYLDAVSGSDGTLYEASIKPVERALLERVLAEAGGNQTVAAARLGLHRNTLRYKLREFGLD